MNSKTTKRFRQMLSKLPSDIRQQAREAYKPFSENSRHLLVKNVTQQNLNGHNTIAFVEIKLHYK